MGRPLTLSLVVARLATGVALTALTWTLYVNDGWDDASPSGRFFLLLCTAPLVAPCAGGLVSRTWTWVPVAAVAFAVGGLTGLWFSGDWTMKNQVEMSLVAPTIFLFPGASVLAAAVGTAIRLWRGSGPRGVGGTIFVVTLFWALVTLISALGMVM